MNRTEYKTKAKAMIKGNCWHFWKPLLIIALATGLIAAIGAIIDSIFGLAKTEIVEMAASGIKTTRTIGPFTIIFSVVSSFLSMILSIGFAKYILSFVRGKKETINDIIDFAKKYWLIAFLVSILTAVIIFGCSLLLVVPGIIAGIGLTFYQETCADNPEMQVMDIIKKAWKITNGHKSDLFVLMLSFIGWIIIAPLTLGILYIWLIPYMTVTLTLVYEDLKKAA